MIARAKSAALAALALVALGACVTSDVAPGKSSSDAAGVNLQLAIEYIRLGNLVVAREKLERALKQDPKSPTVQATAGVLYERLGENAKAEKYYATALRLGKDDPTIQNTYAGFLCRSGRTAEGEKLFVQVARNPLYRTPEVALTNAGVCVRGSATGGMLAEHYFHQALIIKPNSPEAMLQLGDLSLDRDDAEQARDLVQRFLAVNKPTPEVYWLGVRVYRKLGDATQAALYARRLEAEFPNSDQAQILRSGIAR
jgi:type IV pilus assembly protein PilF